MYTLCKGFRCITRQDRTFRLKNDITFIIMFVDVLDGNAAFMLAGCQHRFMYMHAVHAFASKLWEKRRMYIYYSAA